MLLLSFLVDRVHCAPRGNPLCKLASFMGPFNQPEYKVAFELLCPILESLAKLDGRSILQIVCSWMQSVVSCRSCAVVCCFRALCFCRLRGSHGRNRSATLGVGLSAVYDIPVWLPTFGDLSHEWWAVAKLPDEVMDTLRSFQVNTHPIPPPRTPTPPGPAAADGDGDGGGGGGANPDYGHGTFDPTALEGSMPSVGNAVLDSVTWLNSSLCVCVCVMQLLA